MIFDLTKQRIICLTAQIGLLCGAVIGAILPGIVIEMQKKIDDQDQGWPSCDYWQDYDFHGLPIAIIVMCCIAFFAIIPNLLITTFKKDEWQMVQLSLAGLACAMVGLSSLLVGTMLALVIDQNKTN
jgi:MFS family permease